MMSPVPCALAPPPSPARPPRSGGRQEPAARTRILTVGEAGTGKEGVARPIHSEGPARERPFVALDCARLPPAALASALFGGAGVVTRGRAGTLYLREPTALSRDLQARLIE